jgi:hypothetical protein
MIPSFLPESTKVKIILECKNLESGSIIKLRDISKELDSIERQGEITFKTDDIPTAVRGVLSGLVKTGRIKKLNPGRGDGIYKVLIPSRKWRRLRTSKKRTNSSPLNENDP